METLGVPVLAYRTDEFPAFFSRSSGHASPHRADSAGEIAAVMAAKWDLGIAGGIAVVNPIPSKDEIPAHEINGIIDQAIADMQAAGIHGKEATPYLLGRIVEITGGASLTANIALVNNNARLGAQVATEYAALTASR
jgi:pseudouridine-5'-phosphate glycosidase